eukprot:g15434.t1
MDEISEYEMERRRKMERNHRRLQELGLAGRGEPWKDPRPRAAVKPQRRAPKPPAATSAAPAGIAVRKSARARRQPTPVYIPPVPPAATLRAGAIRISNPGIATRKSLRTQNKASPSYRDYDTDSGDEGDDLELSPGKNDTNSGDEGIGFGGGRSGQSPAKRDEWTPSAVAPPPPAGILRRASTPAVPNSSRNLECDIPMLMERYLGRQFPSFGKAPVMELSTKSCPPKFSRMSGVTEWKNAVFLWVNVEEGTGYENLFERDAPSQGSGSIDDSKRPGDDPDPAAATTCQSSKSSTGAELAPVEGEWRLPRSLQRSAAAAAARAPADGPPAGNDGSNDIVSARSGGRESKPAETTTTTVAGGGGAAAAAAPAEAASRLAGLRMTWFAGSRMTAESALIQRLLMLPENPPKAGVEGAEDDSPSAGGAVGPASGARDAVLLFCRLPDEPYVFCGRLGYSKHWAGERPVRFVWRLLDSERLAGLPDFEAIVEPLCHNNLKAEDGSTITNTPEGAFVDDIVKIIPVAGLTPGGKGWADSYSVGDECFMSTTFDHDIGDVVVDTPKGSMIIRDLFNEMGPGPGAEGRPLYNDIQCGNGPANDDIKGDEISCPGLVEYGREGCGQIGTPLGANTTADAAGNTFEKTRGASAHMEGSSGAPQYANVDALGFTATNEYPPLEHSKWPLVAEPFRSTTFTASSSIGDPDKDVFKWSFPDGTVLEGREVKHTFTAVGRHGVALSQTVVSTGNIYRSRTSVMVKYVRREIRQLTDSDREAFFDAMETLYRLPTPEGNALYGEEYKGIGFFVEMHLEGAGVTDCDHWHEDAGIMNHHVGFTLLFEQALQVVDPSVSIPYWEYSIEDGLTFRELGIMYTTRTAFSDPPGMWTARRSSPVSTCLTNGQDLTTVVSCTAYQSCFDSSSLAVMFTCLNGGTHGPVHTKIGGEWDNPEEDLTAKLGYSNYVPALSKILWRKGYLRTPKTCSQEEHGIGDASTCRSSCPSEVYESLGMTPYDVLMDTYALHWIAYGTEGIIVYDKEGDRFFVAGHAGDDAFHDEFWKRVLHSLCDPGHVGDFLASSSPYDPLFWVIHPTAERLLGWRRKLAIEQSDMWSFDETWGYSHAHHNGEAGVVCDWSGVRDGTLDMPTCAKRICGGHKGGDTLPFEVKVKGETIKMTNLQWYKFTYPDNDDLPYMYNEFSWDHCAAEGYYMGTRQSRCLDAFIVALGQASAGGRTRWYTSTLELQLTSLGLCEACRSVPTLAVTVQHQTPRGLWAPRKTQTRPTTPSSKKPRSPGGVPVVRAVRLTWGLPMESLAEGIRMELWECSNVVRLRGTVNSVSLKSVVWPAHLKQLSFGDFFNLPITGVVWPTSLQQLSFGYDFNGPIAGVVWPASLQQLSFGKAFNQPIAGVVWPTSLQQLTFGRCFNQPITGVVWPTSLQQLSFGYDFNQPITGVMWPASVQQLTFGYLFNQPIAGAVWPTSLQQLTFGNMFNQPIAGILWPDYLQQLEFGNRFDQPITGVVWPTSLQQLSFGYHFNKPIAGLTFGRYFNQSITGVVWPTSLQQLSFGYDFNEPIAGVVWPASLQQLSFGYDFDQPIAGVVWPDYLQQLEFGNRFDQPITGVVWPGALQHLTFGCYFNQPIAGVVWPASLQQLTFGYCFNQPIAGVFWPASLQQLAFEVAFNQPITGVVWPTSLQQLSFGYDFNEPIAGVVWPASLQQLTFGHCFNQTIAGVVLPASLQQLSFGRYFNQPIARALWPASLQQLKFGHGFNQPITGFIWPSSLQHLTFGDGFNQPIAGVIWPASLQQLSFGDAFNQPITGAAWPVSLQQLSFGGKFDQPIAGVAWPTSLRHLSFGDAHSTSDFDKPIDGIKWPASLRSVTRAGISLL